jgi:Holliday junction resolvase
VTHPPDIVRFFDLVQPWSAAYVHSTFAFVALLHENEYVILAGRLRLSRKTDAERKLAVVTPNVVAAEVSMAGDVETMTSFVHSALSDSHLLVGEHLLRFPKDNTSGYSTYHDHASSTYRNWKRSAHIECLRLMGARRWDLINSRLPTLERELLPEGYRGLDDLMAEFGFGLSDADMACIEISAEPVLEISETAKLCGPTAEIEVRAPNRLATEPVTLTLADAQSDGRSYRRSIRGKDLDWSRAEHDWIGRCTIEVPEQSILICRALYAGSLHDETELFDPNALPNLRRTLVELADPGLQRLRGPLTAPKTNQEQNDFEAGIAVLLYMLGFNTVRVGGIKKLSEAVDIFALTPSGRVLVVECTTAVLDPKDKLGKLLARIDHANERLSAANLRFRPEQVTGVVVIPKMRRELGIEWKSANERGVLILCRPEIEQALERTRFSPNADKVLDDWLRLGLSEVLTMGLKSVDSS